MRREHAGPAAADPSFPTTAGPGGAAALPARVGGPRAVAPQHAAGMFEIEGDEVRVYADAARALSRRDPDGRQLVMSCGAALVNLRLAAHHFGHATSRGDPSGPPPRRPPRARAPRGAERYHPEG